MRRITYQARALRWKAPRGPSEADEYPSRTASRCVSAGGEERTRMVNVYVHLVIDGPPNTALDDDVLLEAL